MDVTVSIPDAIFRALQQGAGRLKLQRNCQLSQTEARYYIKLYERQSPKAQTAVLLSDLHAPYYHKHALETVLSYCEPLQTVRNHRVYYGNVI